MPVQVTLGGDRLGSGNKQKVSMHDYGMSSFNLEQDWKSSMAPGVLYPFIKMVGTNHGTFDIDLDTFVRTLPTKGPLFGSFKLQLDLFSVPFRLYQGILHNNPTKIGMKMNQVYIPKLEIKTTEGTTVQRVAGSTEYTRQINESALLKYLGLSGIGALDYSAQSVEIARKINAVPALAYYDIFKCYYANKQEQNAYVITPGNVQSNSIYAKVVTCAYSNSTGFYWRNTGGAGNIYSTKITNPEGITNPAHVTIAYTTYLTELTEEIKKTTTANQNLRLYIDGDLDNTSTIDDLIEAELIENIEWKLNTPPAEAADPLLNTIQLEFDLIMSNDETVYEYDVQANTVNLGYVTSTIALTTFELENIDYMRQLLLSANELGEEFVINAGTADFLPYNALFEKTSQGITWNAFTMNGLCVKTYQSDLFNNWLDSEWIDGEEGIAALTAINTESGAFTIDSFIFAEKLYDIYNRIATGGGTYEDWQEAVYGEGAIRKCETPMYIGGMAAEIMFEEVISNSETIVNNDFQPLGSLGGKGTIPTDNSGRPMKRGGKNIHVKCDEPGYIMGIVSITPRISYSQGNDWDLTEIDTLDDLHKPGLDGIGFQDLVAEQMAWWTTRFRENAGLARTSVGKQTAWINYQTAIDKCFGDFAKGAEGYSFMVLNRNYEMSSNGKEIKDLTTYIDPSKFNYAFAVQELAAQNFWVQIHSKVVARRKMGAQQIPNL